VAEFKIGDRVEWKFGRGKARGVVKKKLTTRTPMGSQVVAASPDDPRYLVEVERSGREVAKRPRALRRTRKSPR
jgi:DUF2945 family protein